MATLQKFKLLATQCAVVGSPTRSPTTSPVIHIRRRKTLRMLLSRAGTGGVFHRRLHHQPRREESPDRHKNLDGKRPDNARKEHHLGVRLKLKDLFISSPPPAILGDGARKVREEKEGQRLLPAANGNSGGGLAVVRDAGRALRPLSATFRQREI
ncbi:hypothetical protein Cgig2_022358 [Carnegiea gigantea]|uniref:Uncharacterized protein n=1 Tax=Carnegiea gigantea TaxID=171969 RepID=A0A9Q1KFA4_9CARY|nr:hypothetical protein Cgig2_022358 [Carnegiea gigantea]